MGAIVTLSFVSFASTSKETAPTVMPSVQEIELKGKVLVTYFTWTESDGVDASTGASRIIEDGNLYGNTEFVARAIAKNTKGDLFAIQTEKTYPSPHTA